MPSQPLIRNYGLFWDVADIFWGAGSQAGAMWGVLSSNITADPIDFRDQRGVYVLYGGYELVYVGQNNNQELLSRLKQHKKDDLAGRWDRFSWYGLRAVKANGELANYNQAVHATNSTVLNHIEAILIHSAEPQHNRQGGRFGDDVQQFLQFRDERLGPSEEEMLRQIYEYVKKKGS